MCVHTVFAQYFVIPFFFFTFSPAPFISIPLPKNQSEMTNPLFFQIDKQEQQIAFEVDLQHSYSLGYYSAFSIFHFNHLSHNFMYSENYINCNIIEDLINKVLDVKPLVPFIITEICQQFNQYYSSVELIFTIIPNYGNDLYSLLNS